MCKIKHLSIFFIFNVYFLGLIACSSDNSDRSNLSQPWSIGEVEFLRKDLKPMSMQTATSDIESFKITDQIRFTDFNESTPHTLSAHTLCTKNFKELPVHAFTAPLKKTYNYFEFLSKEAILSADLEPQSPVRCKVRLTIRNSRGDTHSFQLSPQPISPTEVNNSVVIEKAKQPLGRVNNDLFVVDSTDLPTYTLSPLGTSSSRYDLECKDLVSQLPYQVGAMRFDQFQLQNRVNNKTDVKDSTEIDPATPATSPNQICRLFSMGHKNIVEKLSDVFVYKLAGVAPSVSVEATPLAIHKIAIANFSMPNGISLGKFLVYNPTDKDMILSLNTKNAIQVSVVHTPNRNKPAATAATVLLNSIGAAAPGFKPLAVDDTLRFTLAPKQSINLSLGIAVKYYSCNRVALMGIYYQTTNPEGIFLDTLTAIDAVANTQNTLTKNLLVSPEAHYGHFEAITRPSPNDNPLRPRPIVPPKIDSYNNNCRAN